VRIRPPGAGDLVRRRHSAGTVPRARESGGHRPDACGAHANRALADERESTDRSAGRYNGYNKYGRYPTLTSTPFSRRVLNVLRRIPPGKVLTYGDVARFAGKPRAARAVGNIMRAANAPGLPYHRVIAAGGRIGGYGRAGGRPTDD